MKLTYRWINEEEAEIFLNESYVGNMAHGPHGWDGMQGILDVLNGISDLLDWEVEVEGDPAI